VRKQIFDGLLANEALLAVLVKSPEVDLFGMVLLVRILAAPFLTVEIPIGDYFIDALEPLVHVDLTELGVWRQHIWHG
jgi:hypothetical protein